MTYIRAVFGTLAPCSSIKTLEEILQGFLLFFMWNQGLTNPGNLAGKCSLGPAYANKKGPHTEYRYQPLFDREM